jgi:hypothetical protein
MRRRPLLFSVCFLVCSGALAFAAVGPARAAAPEPPPAASVAAASPRFDRELWVAGALGTGPVGLEGERGASVGVRQKTRKYLWLGGRARWFSSGQNTAAGDGYVLHRGLVFLEAAWTLEVGERLRLAWIECAGAGSFVTTEGGSADDWVAPAVMGMAHASWRLTPKWNLGLAGGWLIHWARVDGHRRRASTRSVELNVGYAF